MSLPSDGQGEFVIRHFEEELEELRRSLQEMSGLVETSIRCSVLSLAERDEKQAEVVLQNESRINQMEIEIDDKATRLLALDQPVARDLRFILAAMKINSDLERMGDLAKGIVKRMRIVIQDPVAKLPIDIPRMANLVQSMVRKALDSFLMKDVNLARDVLASENAVDDLRDTIFQDLLGLMRQDPEHSSQYVNLIFVAQNLERIVDHATNIAEDALYLAKGINVRHQAQVSI